MEIIQDTPVKRRRTETGHVDTSQGYSSQNDSGDELFNDYETIATLPLHRNSDTPHQSDPFVSQAPHITQPTQIIERNTPKLDNISRKPSIVQVAASSPVRLAPISSPVNHKMTGGILASTMAPPGTAFRLPVGVTKAPPKAPVIDLSDDEGPTYQGDLSEDDSSESRKADIRPSTFIQRAQKQMQSNGLQHTGQGQNTDGQNRFKEITANSFYKPMTDNNSKPVASSLRGSIYDSRNRDETNTRSRISAPTSLKRSADVMANAYGNTSRPVKQIRQTGPARAAPVADLRLDEIPDYQQRQKIERMRNIIPAYSISMCHNALLQKRGNVDDALELLTSAEDHQHPQQQVDLTVSEDELAHNQAFRAPAKQQVKAPQRTIAEKWQASQAVPRKTQTITSSPVTTPPKPRRRLMKGRKHPSSPVIGSSPTPPRNSRAAMSDDDSDSGVGIDSDSEYDAAQDGQLLDFFNTCSISDLADIAEITDELATTLLNEKPFKSLDAVRNVKGDVKPTKSKKATTKRPMGEKIVEKCQEMWSGYDAVDELVRNCENIGKPLVAAMKKWGVDVFGQSKDGELEIVDISDVKSDESSSLRDSGIGTPTDHAFSADEDGELDVKNSLASRGKSKSGLFPQPAIMGEGVVLKDYQVVGINWLSLLYEKKLSCILADDMGLGKTCQVIAFLAHLLEKGIKGPHLVVVPGSTLENWLREFSIFCPTMVVRPYYAGQKERFDLREDIQENIRSINVIVTTYNLAKTKDDNKFLRRLNPNVCVYDEGHILKNSKSAGYEYLMKIPATFRLLLTGTPLQNNLQELTSLLGFILPSIFKEHSENLKFIFNHKARTTDESQQALLSAQRIARAKSMMTPFILRRKKHQVLKYLPAKHRRIEYCELTESQVELYEGYQIKARDTLARRAAGEKTGSETTNIMMQLRQVAIHPLLFRRIYNDTVISKMAKACVKEDDFMNSEVDLCYEDMTVMSDFELHNFCVKYPSCSKWALQNLEWTDSGKVHALTNLLTTYVQNGDRILIFSQFVLVLNILEAVLETLGIKFFRLDGSTKIDERQDMIDEFHTDTSINVFLLSTKAGGAGINLACANKVIIFDSSFNPQDDIQAENRAHRVGQTREVEVVRLVTRGTIEEQILALGLAKIALDERVAGETSGGEMNESEAKKIESEGVKRVEEMMLKQIQEKGSGENIKTEEEIEGKRTGKKDDEKVTDLARD